MAGRWAALGATLAALVALGTFSESVPGVALAERLFVDFKVALLSPRAAPHPDIALVTITEATLDRTSRRSPIDRGFLARILARLDAMDVAALGIDILIDQPSDALDDARLREQLARMRTRTFLAFADATRDADRVTRGQEAYQRGFLSAVRPAVEPATVRLWADPDGVIRHIGPEGDDPPSLAARLAGTRSAAGALPRGRIAYTRDLETSAGPFATFGAELIEDADETTTAFIRRALRGKLVLVGADLPGIDQHRTPFSIVGGHTTAGVFLHAQLLAQYLARFTHPEPPLALHAAIAVVVVAGGFVLGLASVPAGVRGAIGALVMLALWGGAAAVYAQGRPGMLLPTAGSNLAFIGAVTLGVTTARRRIAEQRNFIRRALAKYVPDAVARELEANPELLSLGGEKREITALFTDIADFTTLSELLEPTRIAAVVNAYLEGMTRIVHAHGGTLDKYIGDAVVAFWGAPLQAPDHAARAVECALALDAFAARFAAEQEAAGIPFGRTRIGVHTGFAIVGNFGGEERFQYTAIGDTMNTASRLEGANKYFGTRILVSGPTAARSGRTDLRPVADLVVKGKEQRLEVFEPVPWMDPGILVRIRRMYRLLDAGPSEALSLLRELAAELPDDAFLRHLTERAGHGPLTCVVTLDAK